MTPLAKRFRIALSFPGEQRAFVQRVAVRLADHVGRERVLYDHDYEAEFARVNLDTYLQRLYRDESELVAVFVCADYERKDWCRLEWRAVRDIIKCRAGAGIMPLRFDDTEILGLFSTDGYVGIGTREPEEIADLIYQRWRLDTGVRGHSRARQRRGLVVPHVNLLALFEDEEIRVRTRVNEAWRILPWELPDLTRAEGRAARTCVQDWKRIHTLSEKLYRDFRAIHVAMLSFEKGGSATDQSLAISLVASVQPRVHDFIDKVGDLHRKVSKTLCLQVLLKLPAIMPSLKRSLAHDHQRAELRDGRVLAERVCAWLLEILRRADAILEKHFFPTGTSHP